jgi:hypothetical protein
MRMPLWSPRMVVRLLARLRWRGSAGRQSSRQHLPIRRCKSSVWIMIRYVFHICHQYSDIYFRTECLWSMPRKRPGMYAPGKGRRPGMPLLLRPQAPVLAPAQMVTEAGQGEAGEAEKENCYRCALHLTSLFSTLTTCRCCGRPPRRGSPPHDGNQGLTTCSVYGKRDQSPHPSPANSQHSS